MSSICIGCNNYFADASVFSLVHNCNAEALKVCSFCLKNPVVSVPLVSGCWACGSGDKMKIVPPGFDLPPVYVAPALNANTVFAEGAVAAPPTSSGRIRKQTMFYDASVSAEPVYKKAIMANRCSGCTNRKDIYFCGAHFGFACGMCMVMGYNCRFEGTDMQEIVSVQVAAPVLPVAPAPPIAPVLPVAPAPPVPTVSATLVNGVVIVTTTNLAINTPVQVVHDLTGDDDGVIDLTGV